MRRPLWIGAAILVAVAAVVPLWMVVSGGDDDRRSGALITVLPPAPLDCGTREIFPGCAELNSSIESIRLQVNALEVARSNLADKVAELRSKGASAETIKAFVAQDVMQNFAQAALILSNISKAQHDRAQEVITNIRG